MRRSFAAATAALLLATAPALAQTSITPTVGWQWGGTLDYSDPLAGISGDVHIEAAETYGVSISKVLKPGATLGIDYWYQASELTVRPTVGNNFKLFDLATHYLQISGTQDAMTSHSAFTPYAIGGLGFAIYDPGESTVGQFDTAWYFSISAGGGVWVSLSDRVDLKLQGRVLVPINFTSGTFWFGSGGAGASMSGNAMVQGDALLGLSFKLGL